MLHIGLLVLSGCLLRAPGVYNWEGSGSGSGRNPASLGKPRKERGAPPYHSSGKQASQARLWEKGTLDPSKALAAWGGSLFARPGHPPTGGVREAKDSRQRHHLN